MKRSKFTESQIIKAPFDNIRVIDVQGQNVGTGQNFSVDISKQPPRLYMVQLIREDRVMGYGRVVKVE